MADPRPATIRQRTHKPKTDIGLATAGRPIVGTHRKTQHAPTRPPTTAWAPVKPTDASSGAAISDPTAIPPILAGNASPYALGQDRLVQGPGQCGVGDDLDRTGGPATRWRSTSIGGKWVQQRSGDCVA
jgi:hypothetical protein